MYYTYSIGHWTEEHEMPNITYASYIESVKELTQENEKIPVNLPEEVKTEFTNQIKTMNIDEAIFNKLQDPQRQVLKQAADNVLVLLKELTQPAPPQSNATHQQHITQLQQGSERLAKEKNSTLKNIGVGLFGLIVIATSPLWALCSYVFYRDPLHIFKDKSGDDKQSKKYDSELKNDRSTKITSIKTEIEKIKNNMSKTIYLESYTTLTDEAKREDVKLVKNVTGHSSPSTLRSQSEETRISIGTGSRQQIDEHSGRNGGKDQENESGLKCTVTAKPLETTGYEITAYPAATDENRSVPVSPATNELELNDVKKISTTYKKKMNPSNTNPSEPTQTNNKKTTFPATLEEYKINLEEKLRGSDLLKSWKLTPTAHPDNTYTSIKYIIKSYQIPKETPDPDQDVTVSENKVSAVLTRTLNTEEMEKQAKLMVFAAMAAGQDPAKIEVNYDRANKSEQMKQMEELLKTEIKYQINNNPSNSTAPTFKLS